MPIQQGLNNLRRLSGGDRCCSRARGDIILNRPPTTSSLCRSATSCGWCSRPWTRTPAFRVIVLRAIGKHFSSGGYIRGFLEASPEHVSKLAWNIAAPARCAKPVIAANRGYCLRRRLRNLAGLRFPYRVGNLLIRAAGAEARPNSRLRRLGAPAKDDRHHAHQGHRDALPTHFGEAGAGLGHRHRMRAGRRTGSGHRPLGRRTTRLFAYRPAHGQKSCSTTPKIRRLPSPSNWKVTATAGCASPMISAKASRHFTKNASLSSAATDPPPFRNLLCRIKEYRKNIDNGSPLSIKHQ